MTSLLDRESFTALLGHEFGHHLAHTDSFAGTARQLALDCAVGVAYDSQAPEELRIVASRLAMARDSPPTGLRRWRPARWTARCDC